MPWLLDLYCGAGGAASGYRRAGFEVLGIDINSQPNYPYAFHRRDALDALAQLLDGPGLAEFSLANAYNLKDFDAIHASPPCQPHVKGLASVNESLGRESNHADLIAATRELLEGTDLPYVIENVEGAPLYNPVRLCGSSFQLPLRRHRLFECNFPVMVPPCNHSWQHEAKYWTSWRPNGEMRKAKAVQVYGNAGDWAQWPEAMQIDWMTRDELREAIPPAYTEHIGTYLMQHLRVKEAA